MANCCFGVGEEIINELCKKSQIVSEIDGTKTKQVGGGLGDFAGKIWRVGLMGNSSSANHVNMLLGALKEII